MPVGDVYHPSGVVTSGVLIEWLKGRELDGEQVAAVAVAKQDGHDFPGVAVDVLTDEAMSPGHIRIERLKPPKNDDRTAEEKRIDALAEEGLKSRIEPRADEVVVAEPPARGEPRMQSIAEARAELGAEQAKAEDPHSGDPKRAEIQRDEPKDAAGKSSDKSRDEKPK